ncbi:hypothetical protein AMATHDRAFT_3720 [Amanita thiersii Skay4041]|uniref:PhoD-like phosphatase metallophosphatase domain-containing protein n=1 Tax=Amanita thiersii Skay4041 TaxID=703135 RepID=A0A2A9NSI6_9AGAR|nr:hypothetical protein AMATHDRAFT_3720 [Amanita thiersii Skay4041]
MILLPGLILANALSVRASAAHFFERNLVYRSPFIGHTQLAHNTDEIHERYARGVWKRQTESSAPFHDEHYPSFYGSDFSTSPFIWSGGVNFTNSVASGDPFDTSIILWTRAVPVSPAGSTSLPDQSVPVCVNFRISTSQDFSNVADSGAIFTSYDIDFTAKVEATGLKPDTKYFYQFSDCADSTIMSPVGTTRTIASPNTPADKVNGGKPMTLAVFSCSQFQAGFFNAYGFAAQNAKPDIFVHLGDYMYEGLGGAQIGREVLGRELATIHDYRQRLNQYRSDSNLLLAHQSGPWITVWVRIDLRPCKLNLLQVANNGWKGGSSDSNDTAAGCSFSPSGACFTDRKLVAVRAYHEWMPIRQVDVDDQLRIWRNFQIGKLLDLTMLDTRHYDRDITDLGYNNVVDAQKDLDNRSLMGAVQEQWFYDTLSTSHSRGAVWRVVGQQIVFTELDQDGTFVDLDAWDGYRSNRRRVLEHLSQDRITNTVILAGDSHANWVSDLAFPNDTVNYDPASGAGALGVEFGGTSVTSGSAFGNGISPTAADAISRRLVAANVDLQWSEGAFRGFFTLVIDPKTLVANYFSMNDTLSPNLNGFTSASFIVNAGENKLSRPVGGGSVKTGALKSQVVGG